MPEATGGKTGTDGERRKKVEDMNERERNDAKMATLYELRLMIEDSEKEEYTKAEILKLIDTIAKVKDQK